MSLAGHVDLLLLLTLSYYRAICREIEKQGLDKRVQFGVLLLMLEHPRGYFRRKVARTRGQRFT